MTPAQKSKITKALNNSESAEGGTDKSEPRHVNRLSRVGRGGSTAQGNLLSFETRDTSEQVRGGWATQAKLADDARESHSTLLGSIGMPAWKLKAEDEAGKKTAAQELYLHQPLALRQAYLGDPIKVANDVFPPRMDLPVLVCDIYETHSTTTPGTLKDLESCKQFSRHL